MYIHWIRHPRQFIKRRSKIVCIITLSLCLILMSNHSLNSKRSKRVSFDKTKLLINQLFDPLIALSDLQNIWNQLIRIWRDILNDFLHDACQLCNKNRSHCYESFNLTHYVNHINQSFYPYNQSTRPNGMGINYRFNLKAFHSLNHSILLTDVTCCDYFHMIRLIIHVQLILHQANIPYFLTKGTLIGTLRHHDIIPWDMNIDLFVPIDSIDKLLRAFAALKKSKDDDHRSYEQDLAIYRFRNIYGIYSYKIFSLRSPRVNGTDYRWPKIDIFPYKENSTHIYAYPRHRHNLGTMNYINKTHIEPRYLRLLGPLLVPSPYDPRRSLKAMVRLGQSNLFYVCEGNRFSHRDNQEIKEPWRLPCEELHQSYLFVQSQRNSTNGLCYEQLISRQRNQSLSFYVYKCAEDLPRSLTKQ